MDYVSACSEKHQNRLHKIEKDSNFKRVIRIIVCVVIPTRVSQDRGDNVYVTATRNDWQIIGLMI